MTAAHRNSSRERLRKALYRAILAAVDQVPVRTHRTVVVEVLATMAAEQAAMVVSDAYPAAGGDAPLPEAS